MVRLKCRYILVELIYLKGSPETDQIITNKQELYQCIRDYTINLYGDYGLACLLQLFQSMQLLIKSIS